MAKKIYFIVSLLLFISCNETNHVRKYSIPKLTKTTIDTSNSVKSTTSTQFTWLAPEHWTLGKENSMRIGSYNIPYNDKLADLSISYFKGDGGGLFQNINRWRGQLNLSNLTLQEINNLAIMGSSNIGRYKMFEIFNSIDTSRAFLCFVLSLDNSTLFLKLDCSKEGIDILKEDLINFINTFQYINE